MICLYFNQNKVPKEIQIFSMAFLKTNSLRYLFLGQKERLGMSALCDDFVVVQLCPTLCHPMDCSTPGLCPLLSPRVCSSSVH